MQIQSRGSRRWSTPSLARTSSASGKSDQAPASAPICPGHLSSVLERISRGIYLEVYAVVPEEQQCRSAQDIDRLSPLGI